VLKDPPPAVSLIGISPKSLDFSVAAWTNADDYLAMLHNLRKALYEDLSASKVDLPVSNLVLQAVGSPPAPSAPDTQPSIDG
jgi:small-conductance mechanosensitive channel